MSKAQKLYKMGVERNYKHNIVQQQQQQKKKKPNNVVLDK
jgi:hypothetical protein